MRFVGILLSVLVSASVALADADDSFKISIDVGVTGFLNNLETNDVLSALGQDIAKYETKETIGAPHVGVNFHFTNKWLLGIDYQFTRREALDVYRTGTPLIDRISAKTFWCSVHAEREFKLSDRRSIFATLGAARSISKGSTKIQGQLASFRAVEIDPIAGIGFSSKFGSASWKVSYLRRFASDDITDLIAVSLRLAPGTN